MRRLSAILTAFALAIPAGAQEIKPTVEVRSEYLMTLEAPLELGQPVGHRVIVNVPAGGSVRGPKINGQLVAPAGDWLYVMPDGSLRLDVRATIKTDDNALIFVEYGGIIAWPKEVSERSARAKSSPPRMGTF
jgi:hypothetical protein